MNTFSQIQAALRRKGRGQYLLLAGCCFFSALLITAYVLMMRSPTVLTVLPEGGDSRKQMMMIFVLTMVGCGMFTAYAAGLFFRYKSRESGIFLVLGATRAQVGRALSRETMILASCSCLGGIVLGGPLAWLVWRVFRAVVVDSQEMILSFDPLAYALPAAFTLYVLVMLLLMLRRYISRADVLDVVSESRRSEPIRLVPSYYGWLGVVLTAVGAFLGYQVPGWIIFGLNWYPPEGLTAIFYLPALIGLYMILLHTVVNGWRKGKSRYSHLVTTSLMRFQGRQTVRNLLVVTVLIAGAYFASFYAPIMGVGAYQSFAARPIDYAFHYRLDQDQVSQEEIRDLAAQHGVEIVDYVEAEGAVLAYDGNRHIETSSALGTTFTKEYREVLSSCTFLPESAWNALMGDDLDLAPGQVVAVFSSEGDGLGMMGNDISLVTNALTGEDLSVTSIEPVLCSDLLFGRRVLDDGDFAALTLGLPADWREQEVQFNVGGEDSYEFALALFNEIVDRSGPEVEVYDGWDPVGKMRAEAEGVDYYFDPEVQAAQGMESISYDQRDASEFRLFWKYMPQFRILDRADFVRTMAVYLLLFVFIALLCFAAVGVILYTRSMTIAITNRQVYMDLRRLGAADGYLRRVIKGQLSRAFLVPSLVGTSIISAFFLMILYFNDGRISSGEWGGALVCAGIVLVMSLLLYVFYRWTYNRVCRAALS